MVTETIKFKPAVAGTQAPFCSFQQGLDDDTHIEYADLFIQGKGVEKVGGVLYCYPCALNLAIMRPELKVQLHKAMGSGQGQPKLLKRREQTLTVMQEGRQEAANLTAWTRSPDERRKTKQRIIERTIQPWGDRLRFLCERAGGVPIEIDMTAVDQIDVQGPCPCGCGQEVMRGRRFRAGHDARFYSYVRKYRSGEKDLSDFQPVTQNAIVAMAGKELTH